MNNDVWLLLGPELGKKRQLINKIIFETKDALKKDELDIIKFFASDIDASSIAFEIQTTSLFACSRLIRIEQIDSWTASDVKIIASAITSKDANTTIIMSSDLTKVGVTLEKTVKKSCRIVFWQLSESEYEDYVAKKSQELGLSMHPDAIELIIFLSGENTLELEQLLSQIVVFVNDKHTKKLGQSDNNSQVHILREDIESWLSHHKQETVFKLFEEIVESRFEHAFMTLEFLLQSGEHPSQIMAGLIYQIKNAVQIKQRLQVNESIDSIFQLLNIRNYSSKNQYKKFISNKSTKSLQSMLTICAHTEDQLRSGGNAKYQAIVINMMLYHICMIYNNPSYKIYTEKSNFYYTKTSNIYLYDW